MTARVNNHIVFDMSSNQYLSKKPVIKFNYKYQGFGDTLILSATDNHNERIELKVKIKNYQGINSQLSLKKTSESSINYHKTNPHIWESKSIDSAIKNLYGSITPIEKHLNLEFPESYDMSDGKCIGSGSSGATLKISSKIELTSYAILQDTNEYSTIAVFNHPRRDFLENNLRIIEVDILQDI